MVAILLGADNGFFYAGQIMHFSSPFTVFLIYHKHSVSDMKDIQGDINTLSYMSRFSLQSKFQTVYEKACTAWDYEKSGDHENAIKKWGEIFGSDFPEYG